MNADRKEDIPKADSMTTFCLTHKNTRIMNYSESCRESCETYSNDNYSNNSNSWDGICQDTRDQLYDVLSGDDD